MSELDIKLVERTNDGEGHTFPKKQIGYWKTRCEVEPIFKTPRSCVPVGFLQTTRRVNVFHLVRLG